MTRERAPRRRPSCRRTKRLGALDALARTIEVERRPHDARAVTARVAAARERKFAAFRSLAQIDDGLIRPERLVADLRSTAPEECILVADPGTPCPYFSAYWPVAREGRTFISNRAHGALGVVQLVIPSKIRRLENRAHVIYSHASDFTQIEGEREFRIRRIG